MLVRLNDTLTVSLDHVVVISQGGCSLGIVLEDGSSKEITCKSEEAAKEARRTIEDAANQPPIVVLPHGGINAMEATEAAQELADQLNDTSTIDLREFQDTDEANDAR